MCGKEIFLDFVNEVLGDFGGGAGIVHKALIINSLRVLFAELRSYYECAIYRGCRDLPEHDGAGGFYIWNLGSLSVRWTEGPLLAGIRTGFAVLPFPGGRNPSRNVIQRFPERLLGTVSGITRDADFGPANSRVARLAASAAFAGRRG
jgi:hypothetical protein